MTEPTTPGTGESAVDSGQPDEQVQESTVLLIETAATENIASSESSSTRATNGHRNWSKVLAFGVIPACALLLALGAGFLKWQDGSARSADLARTASVEVARNSTIAMLSYRPDTAEQQLGAARDLLTGAFRDSYTSLTNDVVIPGARQQQISATASVPAAASVSATVDHAAVLVFVNQTMIVGTGAPTDSASAVRVTMDKIGGHWLVSAFDPIG